MITSENDVHAVRPLFWFVLLLGTMLLLISLLACNPQKKAQNAYKEVLSNDTLKGKIINDYLNAHPPIEGKPTITYLPGAIQWKSITVKDQKEIDRIKDSTINAMADSCREYSLQAYDLGLEQGFKNAPLRVDTIREKIPDLKEANRWRDSTNKSNQLNSYYRGQLDTRNETLKQQSQKITQLYLWIFGIVAILVLSHVARSNAANWISSAKKLFTKS